MKASSTNYLPQEGERRVAWLALGAIAGPILFTLSWLVLGFVSPGYTLWGNHIAPYSSLSQPLSGLGLGPTGPYMNAAFVLSGLLLLAGAFGAIRTIQEMRSASGWICAALLALSPLGMILCGVFTLESMRLHLIGFVLGAGSPALSFLATGLALRGVSAWKRFGSWMIFGSPLTLVLMILFFSTFKPAASGNGVGFAGLEQRALILEVQMWYLLLGWLAFRRSCRLRTVFQP